MDYDQLLQEFSNTPLKTLQDIFKQGCDVNYQFSDGSTLLHYACQKQLEDRVVVLLQYRAKIGLTNNDGDTPIHFACKNNNSNIVKLLLGHNSFNLSNIVNLKNLKGFPPLYNAINSGHFENVKSLFMYGAACNIEYRNLSLANKDINTLILKIEDLFDSVQQGDLRAKLMELTADEFNVIINSCNSDGITLLQIAFDKMDLELVQQIIDKDAWKRLLDVNLNLLEKYKFDANNFILNHNNLISLEVFRDCLDDKIRNLYSELILEACWKENYLEVKTLINRAENNLAYNIDLKHRSYLDGKYEDGSTMLHVVAKNDNFKMVKYLLEHGAIYNARNNVGETPMDMSVSQNICKIFQLLDEFFKGIADESVDCVLRLFTMNEAELLILRNARNFQGKTILKLALEIGNDNITFPVMKLLQFEYVSPKTSCWDFCNLL